MRASPAMAAAMAPMRPAARHGGPAQRAEVAPVFHQAGLGARHIRNGIVAEPERIVGAGLAGRLGRRGADICRHQDGQRSEQRNRREPHASGLSIIHLTEPFLVNRRARSGTFYSSK